MWRLKEVNLAGTFSLYSWLMSIWPHVGVLNKAQGRALVLYLYGSFQ